MKTVYIKRNDLFKDIPMILCNNITTVDESFFEDNSDMFYVDCEMCDGSGCILDEQGGTCPECGGEGSFDREPYQFFLASMNVLDEERFKEYGVPFGYSELLDVHVIPIFDYGTSWSAFGYSKEVEDDYILGYNETLDRSTHY